VPAGQDGLNSFSVFLAEKRIDLQRAKSREFSVTSVAPCPHCFRCHQQIAKMAERHPFGGIQSIEYHE